MGEVMRKIDIFDLILGFYFTFIVVMVVLSLIVHFCKG